MDAIRYDDDERLKNIINGIDLNALLVCMMYY